MIWRTMWISLAIVFAIAFWREARGQDGHAEMHDTYKAWKSNTGYGCCDDRDCRPTRAYVDDQGRWRVLVDRTWMVVPPETILSIPSPDGRSHVCHTPGAMEPRCVVLGEPRI